MLQRKIIAIDFDGTITKENKYPAIGEFREGAKETINRLAKNNCIVIWTCREGKELQNAVESLQSAGITYDYVNESPCDELNPKMRKIIADLYIDDRGYGAVIDWKQIDKDLNN